jgi:hypothetical protein
MTSSISELRKKGYTIIKNAFDDVAIKEFRKIVQDNQYLMKNTRPVKSSRHLAGFHRYPQLEPLHCSITSNPKIVEFINQIYQKNSYITIGLSDITINRSQEWHTDLLRGEFSSYLDHKSCWGNHSGEVFKFLLYLQKGRSLEVAHGKHLVRTPMDDTALTNTIKDFSTVSVPVEPGDVIVMDIRLPHRGSTEEQMRGNKLEQCPKILISTVFGGIDSPLTHQMQKGNLARLMKWDQKDKYYT